MKYNPYTFPHLMKFRTRYDDQQAITGSTPDPSGDRLRRFERMIQALIRTNPATVVECGCWRGLSSSLMCQYMRDLNPDFDGNGLTIIDSFNGLSKPQAVDKVSSKLEGRFGDTSPKHIQGVLKDFPKVDIVAGWIPDALELFEERPVDFVHCDVDLFGPTLAVLEKFAPLLTRRGVIVVDDFGYPKPRSFEGCSRAVLRFLRAHKEYGIEYGVAGNVILYRKE